MSSPPSFNFIRRGSGEPLLLLHGLGGSWHSWLPVIDELAARRRVIAVDLPGFGETPPLEGEVGVPTLADAVTGFLDEQGLRCVDVAGSSMGALLALELARRGVVGATVALDPGGFWNTRQKIIFEASLGASIKLIRLLQPLMPRIIASRAGRRLLFSQLSACPNNLPSDLLLEEMRSYANSPSVDQVLHSLCHGPAQQGAPPGSIQNPLVIGWGSKDRVCFPSEAKRAIKAFPMARLHWFKNCGHFPHWDSPRETTRFILENTGHSVGRLRSQAFV